MGIGTRTDLDRMVDVFSNHMKFAIYRMDSPSPSDVACLAAAAAEYDYPESCKLIVFYFTGHGRIDSTGRCVIATRGNKNTSTNADTLRIEHILEPFDDLSSRNPEIPCLFLFDCCLSRSPENEITIREFRNIVPHNSLLAFATSETFKSAGSQNDGSQWTKKLCERLEKDSSHLCSIIGEVQESMEKLLLDEMKKILPKIIVHNQTLLDRLSNMSPRVFNDYLILMDGISDSDKKKISKYWIYQEPFHISKLKKVVKIPFT